ncbi:MAG: phenylalanine--tRNA ligase subunit beta [bacterium]
MKVTIDWLKSYVDINYSPEELANTLTMLGLEVDALEYQSRDFDGVVVGQIIRKVNHRNSKHLWVCDVDIGKKKLSIVCGAPNVQVGQKVPVAPEGTSLPSGKTIKINNIRGVESQGMICSEAELGISSRSEQIMVLEKHAEVGRKLKDVLGQGEVVIDIDVTPNRPDCFGVIGLARDIAAVAGVNLRKPKTKVNEREPSITELINIEVLDPEKCPRYTARFIGNVSLKPSPWWLTQRLEAVGIRSINNVVDVTNFVMMETGQPLHAFDYDLLKGKKIIVKTATNGEKFTTLDEKSHTLSSSCLMICDGERAVAIGGIMGGQNSEVSDNTKNILLESAYFDPVSIRRTSKFLDVSTESSRRFERGTDPNGLIYALDRAAQLMADLSGGDIAKGIIDVYPNPIKPKKIVLRPERVQHVLGKKISANEIKSLMCSLELKISENKNLEVEVPTFRPDITREADLIEEVARVHGYDNIPADTTALIEQLESKDLLENFTRNLRLTLNSCGFSEVITYSMTSRRYAQLCLSGNEIVEVTNPISEELGCLRPSLIPGLLNVIRWNMNRNNRDLKIFEIGNVFCAQKESDILESTKVAGALTGLATEANWASKPKQVDFFDVKGSMDTLLKRNFITNWEYVPHKSDLTERQALDLEIDKKYLGFFGQLKKELLEEFDIEQPVFVFELDFSLLKNAVDWHRVYSPIPKYPAIKRDIAVVVDNQIAAANIEREIRLHGGQFIQNVRLFDVYIGEQVGSGLKSLAFSLTFYSSKGTLTEKEVDSQIEVLLKALHKKYSARLRE